MEKLKQLILECDVKEAINRTKLLLEEGKTPEDILRKALIPSMDVAGDLFQKGEIFIPELIMAAKAMQESVAVLKPLFIDNPVKSLGKIILGSVKGDMHDIGKNLVGMVFEGAGFEVIDLGVDVDAEKFKASIKEHNPIAIGLSSLLTSTMLEMKTIIRAIEEAGLRKKIKVLIGGAPVNQAYADEIKADFYGADPASAKNYILRILSK